VQFLHSDKENGKFFEDIISVGVTDESFFVGFLGFTVLFIALGVGAPEKIKIGAGEISAFIGSRHWWCRKSRNRGRRSRRNRGRSRVFLTGTTGQGTLQAQEEQEDERPALDERLFVTHDGSWGAERG
jgi:hypothetical protein